MELSKFDKLVDALFFSWDVFHTSRCRGTSWPSGL